MEKYWLLLILQTKLLFAPVFYNGSRKIGMTLFFSMLVLTKKETKKTYKNKDKKNELYNCE